MVLFFTIFFSLLALNLVVLSYGLVTSRIAQGALKTGKTLREAARILPLDLDSPELKKAV